MQKENISLIINCNQADIPHINMDYFQDSYKRVFFNIKPNDKNYLDKIINNIETEYYSIWEYNEEYKNINNLNIFNNYNDIMLYLTTSNIKYTYENFNIFNSHKCVIVIPIYKQNKLTPFEIYSLKTVQNILGNDFDICFICSDLLDISLYYNLMIKNFKIIRFNDIFFKSQYGYSCLLETDSFYKAFMKYYDYMLIYQLDAIVLKNELDYWCDKNYDFIGAPHYIPRYSNYIVGNGGLSLRKIKSFYQITNDKNINFKKYDKLLLEDRWFTEICNLNKCPLKEAFLFANVQYSIYQLDICGYSDIVKNNIPFGVHDPRYGNLHIINKLLEELKIY